MNRGGERHCRGSYQEKMRGQRGSHARTWDLSIPQGNVAENSRSAFHLCLHETTLNQQRSKEKYALSIEVPHFYGYIRERMDKSKWEIYRRNSSSPTNIPLFSKETIHALICF